jgi:CheY-like chemotaxis protein
MRLGVLVVEDDPDVREPVAELLRRAGYHVCVAADGLEALELLAGCGRPGAILLDINMPVMDGWAFLERVRADERLRGIPIAITSADMETPPGCVAIRKPYAMGDVFAFLKQATSEHRRKSERA